MTHRIEATSPFHLICELRPPTRPDLAEVRQQVALFHGHAQAVLIPENHIGIPTVSSLAVAREVIAMGGTPIACLNARDRNLLGFRRDLLTAAVAGVHEFLFVQGDPAEGSASSGLTVRAMVEELRLFSEQYDTAPLAVGVASRLEPLPAWKREADRIFVQASFSLEALLAWRDGLAFDGPVCAGVIVPPSAKRARRWSTELPGIAIPDGWIAALDRDPLAGVELACDLAFAIEESGAFEGVHLIPGIRYREIAALLETRRRSMRTEPQLHPAAHR